MSTVALDVHKRFAEVAVHEGGGLRRLGRIETAQLRAFAASLGPQDHVVLESTAMAWAIAELLAEHAGRVTVPNPMRTRAIASANVETDTIDAKVLAQLGAADFLPDVWGPDEVTRALRRRSRIAPAWCASAPGCATRSTLSCDRRVRPRRPGAGGSVR